MTWYQRIRPINQPFDIGLDMSTKRAQVAFSVDVVKGPSATLAEEIIALLTTAPAVGVLGTTIFGSTKAQVPAEGGPFLVVREDGGASPLYIQNDEGPAYPRPGVTVTAIAPKYSEARTMAWAAFNRLAVVRNRQVVP
jgi:hypothetical protein